MGQPVVRRARLGHALSGRIRLFIGSSAFLRRVYRPMGPKLSTVALRSSLSLSGPTAAVGPRRTVLETVMILINLLLVLLFLRHFFLSIITIF